MKKRSLRDQWREEHGASLVEMAMVLPLFTLLMLGAVDLGRACYLATEVAGAAHSAAAYGSQNPTDTTGMQTAAQIDAPNVPGLSVGTPTYGVECPDGSKYTAGPPPPTTPTCSGTATAVYRVNVTVTGTYRPLFPWPGIPSSISLSSSASMRSAGGGG